MDRSCFFFILSQGHRFLRCFLNVGAFQSRYLNHLTAQFPAQLVNMYLFTGFFQNIGHINRHQHRYAQLHNLGGQIQVSFNIRTVHNIDNGVRPLRDQIIPGYHFLQRVGGEGINSGKVHNLHIFMSLQPSLFFLHRNARPVSHKLIGTGQRVEQCGFAAVRVTCQRNFH